MLTNQYPVCRPFSLFVFPIIPTVHATALSASDASDEAAGHRSRCATGEYEANASIYRGSSLPGLDIDWLNEWWALWLSRQSQRFGGWITVGTPAGDASRSWRASSKSEACDAALLWLLWRITIDVQLCKTARLSKSTHYSRNLL